MHFLNAPSGTCQKCWVRRGARRLVDQVLRRQPMPRPIRQPSSIGSKLLSFGRSFVAWCLNHHDVCTKPAWVGCHKAESRVIGGAGERLHDRGRGSRVIGEHRHARGACWFGLGFVRAGEIDPHQALLFHATIGAAADLGEVDLLAFAQRQEYLRSRRRGRNASHGKRRRWCRRRSGRNAAGCQIKTMSRSANTHPSSTPRSARARPAASGRRASSQGRMSAPRSATYRDPAREFQALRSCIHCPPGVTARLLHRHERQVGIAGLPPACVSPMHWPR